MPGGMTAGPRGGQPQQGVSSPNGGQTPWWSQSGAGSNTNTNFTANAPSGYQYDPVQQKYVRTAASIGSDFSAMMAGMNGATGTPSDDFGSDKPVTPAPQAAQVSDMPVPDTTAANAAAFAQAKDSVGEQMRGALTGLSGAMAGRGLAGSGFEGAGQSQVIQQGQGQLGDVSRQQAVTNADLAQKTAEENQAADVTQRGQTIGENEAAQNSLVSQRGQTMQARQAAADLALKRQQAEMGMFEAMRGTLY